MRISLASRLIRHQRFLCSTPARFGTQGGKDPSISQGHVTNPQQQHLQDPQSQAARRGLKAHNGDADATPLDAAALRHGTKPSDESLGNPERIGFVEQVGSASATARDVLERDAGKGEDVKEEARAPGAFDSMKQALGLDTTETDVKQK